MGDKKDNYYTGEFGKEYQVIGESVLEADYDSLSASLREFTSTKTRKGSVTGAIAVDFANTHILSMRKVNERFSETAKSFDITAPDGMPLVWELKKQGANIESTVYGPSFMKKFIETSNSNEKHYFFGGSQECIERLTNNLKKINPNINICGYRNGYFSAKEEGEEIAHEIASTSPDYIWVGLGTPKQHYWVKRHKEKYPKSILFAIGFAFDVNAGLKKDAPIWMQRYGIGWLFRLLSEPKRLAKRYFKWNTIYLYYLLKYKIKKNKK
jgi:N-acetylglucosaminyldiphosphoundecaprenol N-acetyl-beta-D-mannosaminyltransferase